MSKKEVALYNNNTGEVSKIGLVAVTDPKNPKGFIYATNNSTSVLGIVEQSAQKYNQCNIITDGATKVFCSSSVQKGSIIRLVKSGDNLSRATCTTAKSTDVPYFKIGTALESGRGLIRCALGLSYVASLQTGSFQPAGSYQPLDADLTRLADYRRIGGDANYTQFGADGTMSMVGDATVWDDLRIMPGSFDRPGASDPAYVLYYPNAGGLGTYLLEFAKNNVASFSVQMPHSYKQGSDIYVHLHWTPGANGVTENGHTVGWKIDYSWANINGNFADMQTIDLSDACDGTNHKHQMTTDTLMTGTGSGKTISSMLICNVRRSDTGADDTWSGTAAGALPMLLEVDFHFSSDTFGSSDHSTK